MTTKERLQIVYETLRNHGIVHTKKDLANLIGTSAPNVSNAFKGDERFLTNNFLSRLNKAVNYMFIKIGYYMTRAKCLSNRKEIQLWQAITHTEIMRVEIITLP